MARVRFLMIVIIAALVLSCNDDVLPKPQAVLRLEYPKADYDSVLNDCPFVFVKNENAVLKPKGFCSYNLVYPAMKATIFLTYKPVHDNIDSLLRDADRLTYEHVVKASKIEPKDFRNEEAGVYGMFFRVKGDAASQSQFYVTDSTRHFITGSLYFHVKPNYDSVMPAAYYLENDIMKIMESVRWKE